MIPKSPFTPKQQDLQALTLAKWTFTFFNSLKLALKVFQLLANSLSITSYLSTQLFLRRRWVVQFWAWPFDRSTLGKVLVHNWNSTNITFYNYLMNTKNMQNLHYSFTAGNTTEGTVQLSEWEECKLHWSLIERKTAAYTKSHLAVGEPHVLDEERKTHPSDSDTSEWSNIWNMPNSCVATICVFTCLLWHLVLPPEEGSPIVVAYTAASLHTKYIICRYTSPTILVAVWGLQKC